jgi:peroxiredoxin
VVKTAGTTLLASGAKAPPFELVNVDGKKVKLDDFNDKPALVVAFICNHCPFVKHLAKELARYGDECERRNVAVVAINSNDPQSQPEDAPEKMVKEARDRGYGFPYLFDADQSVAKAYGAACTPDFYVFDRERKLVYHGQFDSSRPASHTPLTGWDVRNAVDSILANKPYSGEQKPSIGCNIKWRAGNEPEYFNPKGV